jgi:hypothetical protein
LEHRNLSTGLVAVIKPDAIFSAASSSSHVTIFFRELDRFGYTAHTRSTLRNLSRAHRGLAGGDAEAGCANTEPAVAEISAGTTGAAGLVSHTKGGVGASRSDAMPRLGIKPTGTL